MMDWNTDAAGRTSLVTLTGWGTARLDDVALAVRVEFHRAGSDESGPPEWLQVAMTPQAARELGASLEAAAVMLLEPPKARPI